MSQVTIRLLTYLTLLVLMGASVAVSSFEIGAARIATHLVIALAQASLVYAIFMQLRAAPPLIRLFAAGTVLWVGVMFGFSLLDYVHR